MKLYLVRHGETECNKAGVYCGWMESPLIERGRKQAEKQADFFENMKIEKIFSSDLSRAVETAGIIGERKKIPVIQWPCFREISFGEWEGKTYLEAQKANPVLYEAWCRDWKNTKMPGGECFLTFYERVKKGLKEVLNEKKDSLIVAHSGVICCIFCQMIGTGMDGFWKFKQDHESYSLLEITEGNIVVEKINSSLNEKDLK